MYICGINKHSAIGHPTSALTNLPGSRVAGKAYSKRLTWIWTQPVPERIQIHKSQTFKSESEHADYHINLKKESTAGHRLFMGN